MRWFAPTIAALATAWPLTLGAAVLDRFDGHARVATVITYGAARHVCHQRAERSFATRGVNWPVCARCAGLYLSAAIGSWIGLLRRFGPRPAVMLAVAATPTAASFLAEVGLGVGVENWHRAVAALPLGLAGGLAIAGAARRTVDQLH